MTVKRGCGALALPKHHTPCLFKNFYKTWEKDRKKQDYQTISLLQKTFATGCSLPL
jgi:hypothetical protein